ncbi:UNVERIFIED_CONTAM: F-box only protein 33 [Gekko kuhli]
MPPFPLLSQRLSVPLPPHTLGTFLSLLEPERRPRPGLGLRPPAAAAASAGPAAMSSVCGGPVGAGSLPSELVVHIFSFLAAPDRLRASAACSHWRECLFYPALWPRLRLSLSVCPAERPRLDFLMRKCGWFVRELRVQFAADNYPSGGGGGGGGGASGGCEEAAAAAAAAAATDGEAPLCPRWLELLRTYLELVLCVLSSVRNNR